ncbi:hypothetical protein Desde_0827 [Desulfitobacterium dehalogenans ATCC 51507]|uniref:Uncharacterized protein n=1 Tax=Desulfitobacterium dehalogenans (strain ATCC 51507 / DSM 9161 / JW/IU-DC1) TaxID=756499 RepID=I4A5N8_DESDJ|nr:hypothetical protein Desde_0827 [Desulfitobacterium dehalogenans ATCC 51507]
MVLFICLLLIILIIIVIVDCKKNKITKIEIVNQFKKTHIFKFKKPTAFTVLEMVTGIYFMLPIIGFF